jgi:hypothetical protein
MTADANRAFARPAEKEGASLDIDAAITAVTTGVARAQQEGRRIGLGTGMRNEIWKGTPQQSPAAPPQAGESKDDRRARLKAHLDAMSPEDRETLEQIWLGIEDATEDVAAAAEEEKADAFYYGQSDDDSQSQDFDPLDYLGFEATSDEDQE